MWLWLALGSGILHGFYDIFRKKALQDIPLLNVLVLYSFFSFLLVGFEFKNALAINYSLLFLIGIKAMIIFVCWIFSFLALRSLPISIATPLDTMTPVFTIVLGMVALNEKLGFLQSFGIIVILGAYYLIGKAGNTEIGGLFKNKYFYLMVGSAFLSAVSALIDKFALKMMNTGQLQFWFCLFTALLYAGAYFCIKIKNNDHRRLKMNYSIVLMSLFLVTADRLYFTAVGTVSSQISVILPLRRFSVLESSIGGGLIFKEKNIKAKFWCVCLVIIGIITIFVGK